MTMLPPAAIFHFPWEISVLAEGKSVRTFGRFVCYQAEESRTTLSAQHASKEYHVSVNTMFVEPFNPITGAQYLVLGETEMNEEVGVVIKARVLTCVDGVNLPLLQKAIDAQRSFFKEREQKVENVGQNPDPT